MATPTLPPAPLTVESFISRWEKSGGSERANYQLFLRELAELIGAPLPEASVDDNTRNAYVFDRAIERRKPDGSTSTVFADLYKRGCFILETKQGVTASTTAGTVPQKMGHGIRETHQWDIALEKAYQQAQNYIRDLPASEGRPPFLIVCDIGYVIELYSEFTCTGGAYIRFPDPRSHRIFLKDLRDEKVRERLRLVWTDPHKLDPAKHAARVTREVADHLAKLSKSLEDEQGYPPEEIARFLQRCLFTMFAEDVGLLPDRAFLEILEKTRQHPDGFVPMVTDLWNAMAKGTFCVSAMKKIEYFNGGLFENAQALRVLPAQIGMLIDAAKPDWADVEPAIFGTLLERALSPQDRHKLGAHYTPRSYVERLVKPTILDPLRERWMVTKAAAAQYTAAGLPKEAIAEIHEFHHELCKIKVLDPACGSGNFLYVTLEHFKRLEGEVLELLKVLGDTELTFEMESFKVRPDQFLGLEINPRAVAIAQLVLWVGYFQWHRKTTGSANTGDEPLLPKEQTIRCQDAVLAYDAKTPRRDAEGKYVTIWDGRTTKTHPVTGREVPDESARIPVYDYSNPRRAEWPEADFIVGNPPFIGKGERMRSDLGDGYIEALREAWKGMVPDSADFVMYWWEKAAQELHTGTTKRFGFISTNSITQIFNRRLIERNMQNSQNPIGLNFAISDHPWVDAQYGAAVRIAMTVASSGVCKGFIGVVEDESEWSDGECIVSIRSAEGVITSNLRLGADLTSCKALSCNSELSTMGVMLAGSGFLISKEEAETIRQQTPQSRQIIRPYRNGKDITSRPRGVYCIDTYNLTQDEMRINHPAAFQILLTRLKPERDANKDKTFREYWWLHGRPRPTLRTFQNKYPRLIATVETAKHRFFQFLSSEILPDHMLVNIADDRASTLSTLSSAIHVRWALRQGGRLGVGNDPRYNKTRCFETFPFPDLEGKPALREKLRDLGEQLDAHRKRQQAAHEDLTMTGMYNVLEKLRTGAVLTDKERVIHEQGLVSVLKHLHDAIDAAVLEAYGWSDLQPAEAPPLADRLARGDEQAEALEQDILTRLVALNHERAAEEARGHVRWLRPDYQNPQGATAQQATLASTDDESDEATPAAKTVAVQHPWPESLKDQVGLVKRLISSGVRTPEAILKSLQGRASPKRKKDVAQILETLEALGQL